MQPEAYTLTAHDVASHSFEHTDVAVREAAWDGRVLRILYSVRDRTVERVFTDEDIWDGNYDLPGARQDGITADWGCDYVYVNGVKLCLTGYMASRAGSEPGEVLVALESDLVERIASEKADITLGDTFEVWLPIIGMGGKDETPEDLHFTVQNTDLVGVRHIALPEKTVLDDGTEIEVTNFMITPIPRIRSGDCYPARRSDRRGDRCPCLGHLEGKHPVWPGDCGWRTRRNQRAQAGVCDQ